MSDPQDIANIIAQTRALIREKLGVRSRDMARAARKAKHRLPRGIYQQAVLLAQAEPLSKHPKLRLTLDATAVTGAADEVQKYLNSIDLADRRRGWFLGMFGGLAFNLILFCVLLAAVLVWRGYM